MVSVPVSVAVGFCAGVAADAHRLVRGPIHGDASHPGRNRRVGVVGDRVEAETAVDGISVMTQLLAGCCVA